ncbi:hypothetical protein GMO_00280 [Gluconobacter morbifer G707]|uniref:Uncharacterized protein n=1 Tax=Gluconobacter morbifer G707 TaxID=1088869 RepID=G6XEW3_9PROT|nr:hypothetical protein GMO_00280 [Gluconobacter morbifer G707]
MTFLLLNSVLQIDGYNGDWFKDTLSEGHKALHSGSEVP